jgi:hypothetical protein
MDILKETLINDKRRTVALTEKKGEWLGSGSYFPLELTISLEGRVGCGNPNCHTHYPILD